MYVLRKKKFKNALAISMMAAILLVSASATGGCPSTNVCDGCENPEVSCGTTGDIGVEGSITGEFPVINIPTGVGAGPQSFNFELPSGG